MRLSLAREAHQRPAGDAWQPGAEQQSSVIDLWIGINLAPVFSCPQLFFFVCVFCFVLFFLFGCAPDLRREGAAWIRVHECVSYLCLVSSYTSVEHIHHRCPLEEHTATVKMH